MRRLLTALAVALAASVLAGCVERRFVVTSDPPGAILLENNRQISATPADDHFVYYGNYHFTLIKDGYATLQVDQKIPAPWYEYFPLDFLTENLFPWKIIDRREFHYQLVPAQQPNLDELLSRGQQLRNRGNSIAPPAPPSGPPAATLTPGPSAPAPAPVMPPATGP
jgi:hypothetical protein